MSTPGSGETTSSERSAVIRKVAEMLGCTPEIAEEELAYNQIIVEAGADPIDIFRRLGGAQWAAQMWPD